MSSAAPRLAPGTALLPHGEGTTRIEFLDSGIIRLHQSLEGDAPPKPSWAVVSRTLLAQEPEVEQQDGATIVRAATGTVRVIDDGGFEILGADGERLIASPASGDLRRTRQGARLIVEYPPGERTFGLGEKTGHLDKRGTLVRMWNTDHWLYDRTTDPIYKSVPFWLGVRGDRVHGVFVDDPGNTALDFGATEPEFLRITVRAPAIDLHVIPGPDTRSVIDRYTALTGRPAMPPRWALGYHQCRYSYFDAERVQELVASFQRKKIPLDAIWLDIHHMDGFRSFTWSPHAFEDPKGLIEALDAEGVKTVAIVDPGLHVREGYDAYEQARDGDHLVKAASGEPFVGECWPGDCVFPDFTAERTRTWWGGRVADFMEVGLAGLWNDMNEPAVFGGPGHGTFPHDVRHDGDHGQSDHASVHNVYGHLMAKASREGIEERRPAERPFVLSRSAYAGTQRYAATWSGDNDATWDDMRLSLVMALNMGMSGFPLYGPDLGGFGGTPSPELMTRWLQLGAFFGLMRMHSALGTPDQEPWSFGFDGEERHRDAILLRYRLLPYTYALHHEAARTGMPPMRPLWSAWPENEWLAKREDVFLYGDDLLVAPVLREGVRLQPVPVPPGRWFTFPKGVPVPTNRGEVTLEGKIEDLPMLVRAGAIVPWDRRSDDETERAAGRLEFLTFPGADGAFTLLEDDGTTRVGEGLERRIAITSRTADGRFEITIAAPQGDTPEGAAEHLRITVPALPDDPRTIEVGGSTERTNPVEGRAVWSAAARDLHVDVAVSELPTTIGIPLSGELFPEANTTLAVPTAGSGSGELDLGGPAHRVAPHWWITKRIGATARLSWTAEAVGILVEVRDEVPGPACANAQEDGLTLVLQPHDGADPVRYRLAIPEEGGGSWKLVGRGWIPTGDVTGSVERERGRTVYELTVPASTFGQQALAAGMSLPFDLAIQHSDRTGRRALVEWVQALTRSWATGGRLLLS